MTNAVHHDQDFYSWAMHNARCRKVGWRGRLRVRRRELEDMGAAKERELEGRWAC